MCIASVEFVQKGNFFHFLFFPQRKERAFLSDLSLHFPFNIHIPPMEITVQVGFLFKLAIWNVLCEYRLYLL